ncbi:MAG: hypothetical protein AAF799_20835 [Myxococcota bacterium]
MNLRFVASSLAFATGLQWGIACGDEAPCTPGSEACACTSEGLCLTGLTCLSGFCVDPDASPMTEGFPSAAADTGDGTGPSSGSGPQPDPDSGTQETGGQDVPLDSVSILVVVDNTGTMGDEQAALSEALGEVPGALEAMGISWRLGITTTDDGNPWCQGTGPEAGELQLSSCRSRPDEFVFDGLIEVDVYDICENPCPPEWATIQVEPTGIFDDPVPEQRPWMESIAGDNNLPAGLSYPDAVHCLVPQGISGCGFEEPLESMYKAVLRAQTPGEDGYGFVPPGALLVVLFVTDEVDCSYNPDHETIFLPDGERVFWEDPTAAAPSSALCWNAGVSCLGEQCEAENYGVTGAPVAGGTELEDAVLYPVSRYADQLAALDDAIVMTINGVQSDGGVVYQPGTDPDFVADFGIGPGCEGPHGPAVPPVRVRELAMQFTGATSQNEFSACDPSYADAMDAMVSAIQARLR